MTKRNMTRISVDSLPSLIAEIDAMRRKPTRKQREEIIAHYRAREWRSRSGPLRICAVDMINEYLIDVLWRTRKYR